MTLKLNGTNSEAAPAYAGDDADTGLQCGTNDLKLVTGGSARATVDSAGRLLVGTSSSIGASSDKREIIQAIEDSGARICLGRDSTSLSAGFSLGGTEFYSKGGDDSFDLTGAILCRGDGTHAAGDKPTRFEFQTTPSGASSPTEVMRLDSSGQLHIGTTSGIGELNVASGGDAAIDIICDSDNNGSNNWPILNFRRNSATGTPVARIYQQEANNALVFDNNGSERMRIRSDGYSHWSNNTTDSEYYGQTTAHMFHQDTGSRVIAIFENSGNSAPSGILIDFTDNSPDNNSAYFMKGQDSSANRFYIWSDGDLDNHDNSYGAISDEKLKQDVVDAGSQWDDLKNLRVRKFKFKEDVAAYGDEAKTLIGLVAQEAETVCPGLVKDNPDLDEEGNDLGTVTKSVRYSVLYMKAIKALQEAQTRIETLESQHADLLARVTALEAAS